jgi:hypothetical protein
VQALQGAIRDGSAAVVAAIGGIAQPTTATPVYRAPENAGLAAAATAMGGVANMLPGTRGGPNINEGVGARGGRHQGQDLGLDIGDPIHARRAGTVQQAYPSGFGKVGGAVVMRYDDGSQGTYGHVSPGVRVGQSVAAGQRIATVAPDGQNTHLHYELRDGFGKLLNPLNAIKDSLRIPAGSVAGGGTLATTAGLPAAVMSALPVSQQVDGAQGTGPLGESLAGLAGQSEAATASLGAMDESFWTAASTMSGFSNAAASTPPMFGQLNTAMGAAAQALAGIGMIGGGIGMMSGGGTYNTLMGLAGIFGGISSVAGMLTPGGALGGLFKGGGGSTAGALGAVNFKPAAFSMPNLLTGKATGGPVRARRPYVVGEKGMELFIPSSDGAIVPNNKLYAANAAALQDGRALNDEGTDGTLAGAGAGLFSQNQAAMVGVARAQQQQQQELALQRAAAAPTRLEFNYQSEVINNVEYVTADQFQRGMADAAERGRSLTLSSLQNSVKARRRVGI